MRGRADRRPAPIRQGRDARLGVGELPGLLGNEPEHLMARARGSTRERRVRQEARKTAQHRRLPTLVRSGLARLSEPALDHLVGREALEEDLLGSRDRSVDVLGGAAGEDPPERLVVDDREVQDAQPLGDGPAAELVCAPQERLIWLLQVATHGEGVGLGERRAGAHLSDGPFTRRPPRRSSSLLARHFVIVTTVPRRGSESTWKSSISRRAPGIPSPRPPLGLPSSAAATTSGMPGPRSSPTTTSPARAESSTGFSTILPRPALPQPL